MYSSEIRSALGLSGWNPQRKVPVGHWIEQLRAEGFSMSDESVGLLESFGGLTLWPARMDRELFIPDKVIVDPVLAASGEFDRIDYWQDRLRVRFSPLGEVGGQSILLLAEAGVVFEVFDSLLWLIGESFADALENRLLFGRRWPIEIGRIKWRADNNANDCRRPPS